MKIVHFIASLNTVSFLTAASQSTALFCFIPKKSRYYPPREKYGDSIKGQNALLKMKLKY